MGIVTLLTDFGLEDAWVGIMKGVVLGINPAARIVDISHQVPPQDIAAAAWTIAAAYPYFPPRSVHVIVVDPGVGSDRDIICARRDGHIFVAPNNGVLTRVLPSDTGSGTIRIVENRALCLEPVSNTFHGRDILAPAGAHLSLSQDISIVGSELAVEDLVRLALPVPVLSQTGELQGAVIMIDRFGNLITNIDRTTFAAFQAASGDCRLEIAAGDYRITELSDAYAQAGAGEPLAIFGSMGYLEIALFCQDAGRRMNLSCGAAVTVSRAGQTAPAAG